MKEIKSEKAKEILNAGRLYDDNGYDYVHLKVAQDAVRVAEQDAEERYTSDLIANQQQMQAVCDERVLETRHEVANLAVYLLRMLISSGNNFDDVDGTVAWFKRRLLHDEPESLKQD